MSTKLNINQFPSDFTYFHSEFIINIWKKYNFTEFYATSHNSYVCERLDYKNPDKGNNIVFCRKSDAEDSKVGFVTDMHNRTNMFPLGMPYRHFLLEGDIWLSELNMNVEFCKLIDNSRGNTFRHSLAITNGCLENVKLEINKWYHIRIYFDCENLCSYLEIDGNFICRKEIEQYFIAPTFYELSVCGGVGEVRIREWEITGLSQPATLQNGTFTINHSSQFPDDSVIENYLEDKIVFNGDAGVVFYKGRKMKLKQYSYQDNDLYVGADDFNTLFGTDLKCEVAVKEKARELGFYSKNSGYGKMVIVSKKDDLIETSDKDFPWFDSQFYSENLMTYPILSFTDAQEVSNFVFFDRPSPEHIKKDFYNKVSITSKHPRLMAVSEEMEEIKKKRLSDNKLDNKINIFLNSANILLERESVSYKFDDDMRTLWNCWHNFEYIGNIAFAYALTGEKKYSDKVIKELLNVTEFPDLNPCHIIDMGQWLYTLALGYDFCYDEMSDAERKKISEFIIEKGIKVINRAFYGMLPSGGLGEDFQLSNWFVRWKSNYAGFVFMGLIPAALAVFEDAQDVCADTISKALRSFEYMLYGLYPDGVWLEGKSYMIMVYKGIAAASRAMELSLGNDYGLLKYPGVRAGLETCIQYDSMVASFSFGDDSERGPFSVAHPHMSYFAQVFKDDLFYAWRNLKIDNYEKQKEAGTEESIGGRHNRIYYGSVSAYDILFHKTVDYRLCNKKVHHARGGEIFTYHENIFDKNAVFVAVAGGPTRHYHFHEDGGDFLICKNGERWTWDFGQGDYNIGTIFTRFSGRAEAHNTLVINPSEDMSQKLQAFAPICDYAEVENGAYAVIDMTELYAHHGAESVFRRFDIENGIITITDNMNFYKSMRGYWIMHTLAEVIQVSDNTVALHQNGKCLYLNFSVNGAKNSKLILGKSRPLEESPKLKNDIQANSNVNSIKLYFDGVGNITISAKFSE